MKTLVTGALGATPEELNMLSSLGLDITLHQQEREPVSCPEQYEAVVCNGLFQWNDIAAFTSLRYIQLTSAGYDRMPMDYIAEHGITIRNAAGVYSAPMAEWTVMALLELFKNADKSRDNQLARRWEKDRSWRELGGKTACVVGFGAYGQAVAKGLKAFDMTVRVVNRTKKESPFVDSFHPLEELEQVLAVSDVVVLAIALAEGTESLIDLQRIQAMKPSAVLINAARGGLVDENALAEALQSGHLAGAALDVFRQEPLPESSPLWDLPNVILTPHNSFVGEGNHGRMMEVVKRNICSNKNREWQSYRNVDSCH